MSNLNLFYKTLNIVVTHSKKDFFYEIFMKLLENSENYT